jgi:hypothetical protein
MQTRDFLLRITVFHACISEVCLTELNVIKCPSLIIILVSDFFKQSTEIKRNYTYTILNRHGNSSEMNDDDDPSTRSKLS